MLFEFQYTIIDDKYIDDEYLFMNFQFIGQNFIQNFFPICNKSNADMKLVVDTKHNKKPSYDGFRKIKGWCHGRNL